MTATGHPPPQPPVTPATTVAWRRRREASAEPGPHQDGPHRNDRHQGAPAATLAAPRAEEVPRVEAPRAEEAPRVEAPQPGRAATDFAETQQAGLATMLGFADVSVLRPPTLVPPPREWSAFPGPVFRPPPVSPARVAAAGPRTGRGRRPGRRPLARRAGVALLAILAVQAVLSLRLAWSNTAFMDEALYLWAGHLEIAHLLNGSAIPAFSTYFSGAPVIYPVLGAVADAYGGLALARLLSLAFMLGSTALLYSATGRLFGRRAALGAAAVFAVLGPVQVLGAFATFDAMSVFGLALACWLVVRAQGRLGEPLLIAAALVMVAANAAKYASALWDPVIIVVAAATASQGGWLRSVLRGARLTGYLAAALGVALVRAGGHGYVRGVEFTTLLRQAGGTPASALTVFEDSANWVGLVFILAVIGVGISFTRGARTRLLCITLTAAVLLAPVEQARIHILTSLHKHVAFGAWFAAMVAGYALARAAQTNKARGWRVFAAAAGIGVFLGVPQADTMFAGWPNSSAMVAGLAPVMSQTRCPCLVTENNVVSYYLLAQTISDKLVGAFSFYYWDGTTQRVLHGLPAYRRAIASHYFRVAEVDPDENPAIYTPVTRALASTPGWRLIDRVPSGTPHEPFEIWRYELTRSGNGPRR